MWQSMRIEHILAEILHLSKQSSFNFDWLNANNMSLVTTSYTTAWLLQIDFVLLIIVVWATGPAIAE